MDNIRTHKKILIPAGIIVIVAALLIIFNAPISKALGQWNFVPKKETYTELYFNNPENLPKQAVKGGKAVFSFTIHNVEGDRTTYPYTVEFVYSTGRRTRILKGTVTLNDAESKTVNVSHAFADGFEQGKVEVTLTNLNQSIDFLIPNNN